jgi:glycosyltransferase involved in cell wall biosynthesis
MRICFLADAGSINTRSWVDYFADRFGHDVHVVSIKRGGELSPRVTLHQIGPHRSGVRGLDKLTYVTSTRRIRRLLDRLDPDLVVGYRVASYGHLGASIGFHPLVVVAQGQHVVAPGDTRLKFYLARKAIAAADLLHAWAPHTADRLIELGADPKQLFTCPRGIDLERFTVRPRGLDRGLTVIATRALHRSYCVDRIVRAVAIARHEIPEIRAAIVGDGEARAELEALAGELGVADQVNFMGDVDNRELPDLLHRSSIYVSAVPTDGVSASLLEAAACGCFPVVPDNAANRFWIRDGVNGCLLNEDSAEALAGAFVRAWRDTDLRDKAEAENRRIAEERGSLSTNMATIEERYSGLVEAVGKR